MNRLSAATPTPLRHTRLLASCAAALAAAALNAGCGDTLRSKESRQEIAEVRRTVEARPEAVNEPTRSGELPLTVAMRTGSRSLQTWLISRGASATARDSRGATLLHSAVIYDRPRHAALRALLDRGGFVVDVEDRQGATPLHLAARLAQGPTIELLLRAGADPDRPDALGRTPLHVLGDLLLPPDPKLRPPDPKSAAAQPAAVATAMDRLLAAGARFDAADRRGARPLHAYAWSGNAAAVRAALARGAPVSAVDSSGRTALFLASAFAHVEVVSLLLEAGADPRHRDDMGLTVLDAMRHATPAPTEAAKVVALLTAAGATGESVAPVAAPDAGAGGLRPSSSQLSAHPPS